MSLDNTPAHAWQLSRTVDQAITRFDPMMSEIAIFRQLSPTSPATTLADCFHGISDGRKKSPVRADEGQIVIIRYVGLRANPQDLRPEQTG